MPTNFRLAYTNGIEFIDLFPSTSIAGIVDSDNLFEITTLEATIPAPSTSTTTQIVTISTTAAMVDAPFQVILNSTGTQAESDFATINQLQVTENQLLVTRLYSMPVDSIDVTLIFFEQRRNL